ncbi:RNA polymerase sigma-70 factor (ECF subfamily) [Kutzneria viridogrisea]|uniref:RNA polymerase sigma-70 factor (ECF subfamily) n=1 Tax=Kutzneria viridogrisea TaxID=47990 RepID=A0ABR6B8S3_9PSEU|nr:RNA polymerase sigma-70 factor (ECF subfamily) [Kutzneria viridogrisea]
MTNRDQGPGTDAELWAIGDQAAFAQLFERHAEAVWNHAYRLTASWSLAEDLTSLTFLTAWRKRAELNLVRDSARPWLYAVAGALARTEFRRVTRLRALLSKLPFDLTHSDHAEGVAEQVDTDRGASRVLAAVDRLPRAEQEAVRLCLLGEVSTADAAAVLGIAEVTVRSRLSRARARLRELLPEETS